MPPDQPDLATTEPDVIGELRRQRSARPRREAPVRRPAAGTVAVPDDMSTSVAQTTVTDQRPPGPRLETVAPSASRRRAPVDGRQVTWFVRVSAEVEELAMRRLGEMQARGLRSSKTELTEALLRELDGRTAKELVALVEQSRAR